MLAMDSGIAIQENSWSWAAQTGDAVQSHMCRVAHLLRAIGLCAACA
jgi:hypothetical protein